MALPPLYKYLNVDGATKTLGNECFRFAKPSEYEDLEDMTAQSIFPDELETALAMLSDGFVDVIVENRHQQGGGLIGLSHVHIGSGRDQHLRHVERALARGVE